MSKSLSYSSGSMVVRYALPRVKCVCGVWALVVGYYAGNFCGCLTIGYYTCWSPLRGYYRLPAF